METRGIDNAFPLGSEEMTVSELGLTKREYFAARAMQGFLASYSGAMQDPSPENVANKSLDYADALINQLNKQ